jgi:hypothetical protein
MLSPSRSGPGIRLNGTLPSGNWSWNQSQPLSLKIGTTASISQGGSTRHSGYRRYNGLMGRSPEEGWGTSTNQWQDLYSVTFSLPIFHFPTLKHKSKAPNPSKTLAHIHAPHTPYLILSLFLTYNFFSLIL